MLSPSLELIFWISLGIVVYTYLLYPLILYQLYALAQMRRDWSYLVQRLNRRTNDFSELPAVSMVVPVYNEAEHLPEKLASLLEMDYPPDKLEIIFISDGSTDGSNEILARADDRRFSKIYLAERRGKANGLNVGVARARNEILVFSDAPTLFAPDTIRKLVRHFTNPRVGAVCGSLKFRQTAESRETEGVYWKYETMLRLMEARLGATLTASGSVYAMRRECFHPLSEDTILDDLLTPMNARRAGLEVVYDPEAEAIDLAASNVAGEFARRVRIAVGSFRALGEVLRVPLDGVTCLALLSHKLLRWFLPFFLLALLISNALLANREFYQVMLAAQIAFYIAALLGYLFRRRDRGGRLLRLCYYLSAMHFAFLVGFIRFLTGRGRTVWVKAD